MKLSELTRVHQGFQLEDGIADGTYYIEEVDRKVDELMTYAPWDANQIESGNKVRLALKHAYIAILGNVPSSPSRTRALNLLTDCRMLANQAITFRGEV